MVEEVDISCWGQHPGQKKQVGCHPQDPQDDLSWHHLPAESSTTALSIAAYPGRCPQQGVYMGLGNLQPLIPSIPQAILSVHACS